MKTKQEPLYVKLNRKWKEEIDKQSYENFGMSYEEHEEYKRQEKISDPNYVPCYKKHGFESMKEYLKYDPSQEYDENITASENLIYANTMRQEKNHYRNDLDYWDSKEKGYDY